MTEKVIIAGFGGQGVMLSGMLLAQAGLLRKREVTWLPSYGPEMRGGTANCHVTVSSRPIASPVILAPDCAIVMNLPSFDKYERQVVPGGLFLVNSSLVTKRSGRKDFRVVPVPVNELAQELGNAKTANMVMLGAYAGVSGALDRELFIKALEVIGGKKDHLLIDANVRAFDCGMEYVTGGYCGEIGA
ncbi:2-oxoacid:acceptor oxidoreductase family protein [Papillibacter cinnamivorans]|uniref:2-oxoglutarate ferredoxin oxidoreductase subunit gamma n=1 Tax=Papillibacter cinnamivorans DSM 12816 TaxID=1122930 RepID=A0A1W2CQQ0_9FIRM|nr:2-oxoacid:acceptor oxidoreductase family protein [Papillibacter cinnamivorans]SMC87549.1 2-oxoglutarate ferredoxin oxidoreductase subunit gamma [Papillibacter cinnamivorans DSM 12816]